MTHAEIQRLANETVALLREYGDASAKTQAHLIERIYRPHLRKLGRDIEELTASLEEALDRQIPKAAT